MKCIYCQKLLNKSNTKSIEHIIPESLGNKSVPILFVIIAIIILQGKLKNHF